MSRSMFGWSHFRRSGHPILGVQESKRIEEMKENTRIRNEGRKNHNESTGRNEQFTKSNVFNIQRRNRGSKG